MCLVLEEVVVELGVGIQVGVRLSEVMLAAVLVGLAGWAEAAEVVEAGSVEVVEAFRHLCAKAGVTVQSQAFVEGLVAPAPFSVAVVLSSVCAAGPVVSLLALVLQWVTDSSYVSGGEWRKRLCAGGTLLEKPFLLEHIRASLQFGGGGRAAGVL